MAPMDEPEIKILSERVRQLIALCDQMQQQNRHLIAQERNWRDERMQLIEKNDLARQKVEAMILRLKALEHDS
jgi:cell division protein ZapB